MGETTWTLPELDAAYLAVRAVVSLLKDVGLPVTLAQYGGINKSLLEEMAHEMITRYHRPMNPRPMGEDDAVKLWCATWEGLLEV